MSPPPESWLLEHLRRTGVLDHNGVGRRAVARRCKRCRQLTLTGLDADRAALVETVDPTPLSPLGEALALLAGRRTLTLNKDRGRFVLNHRYDLQITSRPAGSTLNEDVLRTHQCHTPPLEPTERSGSRFPESQPPPPAGSPPPF